MNKQSIRSSFEKHGEFLSVTQVAEILGIDRGTARGILHGLAFVPLGKKKLYHVSDIAERLNERKQV